MRTILFSQRTVLAPDVISLFGEQFGPGTTTLDTPLYLKGKGVLIEGGLLHKFLPISKPHKEDVQCIFFEPEDHFLDSDINYRGGLSLYEFWFVASVIMTRFINKESMHYIDDLPLFGVVVYVNLPLQSKDPLPFNIYREETGSVLRIRSFPYNASSWDRGTKVFTK
jgi:hypothetical protein